jgi:hypothetical protein
MHPVMVKEDPLMVNPGISAWSCGVLAPNGTPAGGINDGEMIWQKLLVRGRL